MKKIIVISLVVIMLAVSIIPALAAGGPPANRGTANGNCTGYQTRNGIQTPYALSGTITAVDDVNHIVSVNIGRIYNP